MGGKPSLPGAACSALGGSGGAPRVVLLGRGSSFPLPPRKARDTHSLKPPSQTVLHLVASYSLAQHWARDWRALALTQVHHGSRLSDSCEGGEALSSVHPPTPATGKLIHDLLCDGRVKND